MKTCTKCKQSKNFNEYGKSKVVKDGFKSRCKLCTAEDDRSSYHADPEKQRKRGRDKYQRNIIEYRKKSCEYVTNRRKIDPIYRLKENVRKRIGGILRKKRLNKNNNFAKYIGCTLHQLKDHLEKQFKIGMTWDNYGDWEVDHIIPLSTENTSEGIYKLNHYSNLQPLWMAENRSKFNKIV